MSNEPHIVLTREDVLAFREMLADLPADYSEAMRAWLSNFGDRDRPLHALFEDQELPMYVRTTESGERVVLRAKYHGARFE